MTRYYEITIWGSMHFICLQVDVLEIDKYIYISTSMYKIYTEAP
jgi:hypothetical protein